MKGIAENNIQIYKKDDTRVVYEYFPSIYNMLQCFQTRKNNDAMKNEFASMDTSDEEWYGTSSYEEAVKLLKCGYTDILDRIRSGTIKLSKTTSDYEISKSRIIKDVQGIAPIVPNYLKGLPESMTYRTPIVRKIKTINIIYCPCANCGTDAETFIKAGVALLSAIRTIEKSHISVKLDCMFSDTYCHNELIVGVVRLKNYRDRLDLQKLCFPIANPAMLRRIGFKYIETAPDLQERGFSWGYGRTPSLSELEGWIKIPERTVLINMDLMGDELNYDPNKVIEYINKKILR